MNVCWINKANIKAMRFVTELHKKTAADMAH